LSALDMKIEGLNSRLGATDKILGHTRDQLRDKNEALRGVERNLKEATIEKNTLDRRLEATQQEVERQVAMVNELQRSRIELQERVEMLNKAIAAKDFQIESSDNKVASLSERIDQVTKRFEQERNTLEAANRRLTEELQNEKAERSLIQGALEISRESRVKIQKKYVTLRKNTRLDAQEEDPSLFGEEEVETNVRALKSSDAE
jgi:crescentin